MNTGLTLLGSIAGSGLAIAFLHAAIPTHWLPFVLAARGQGWGTARTLGVVLLAGSGHVLFTVALGALLVFLGIEASAAFGSAFPWIAGAALIAIGFYYFWRQWRGGGHGHTHLFGSRDHAHPHPGAHDHTHGHSHAHDDHGHDHGHDHSHPHPHPPVAAAVAAPRRSDRVVVMGLFALLTFSPCEGFLPVYLSGISFGWAGFLLLSAVLAAATVTAMVFFTWLSLRGLKYLDLTRVERFEAGVLGTVFLLLGVLVAVGQA